MSLADVLHLLVGPRLFLTPALFRPSNRLLLLRKQILKLFESPVNAIRTLGQFVFKSPAKSPSVKINKLINSSRCLKQVKISDEDV